MDRNAHRVGYIGAVYRFDVHLRLLEHQSGKRSGGGGGGGGGNGTSAGLLGPVFALIYGIRWAPTIGVDGDG